MALTPRSIRIDDEMWERWKAEAAPRRISVSALIIERMELSALAVNLVERVRDQPKENGHEYRHKADTQRSHQNCRGRDV
jgi:predicted DNA-binding protein